MQTPSYPKGSAEAVARDEQEHQISDAVEEQTRKFFDRLDEAEARVKELEACVRWMVRFPEHLDASLSLVSDMNRRKNMEDAVLCVSAQLHILARVYDVRVDPPTENVPESDHADA